MSDKGNILLETKNSKYVGFSLKNIVPEKILVLKHKISSLTDILRERRRVKNITFYHLLLILTVKKYSEEKG